MAETSEEKKLSLKIMVDIKAKKVVFAEADKEFVDFIFSLISLPLSTVTKVLLLNEKGMAGSLCALYKSIESLGAQYFEPNIKNESVLRPRASVNVPLLSILDWPPSTSRIFKCNNTNHNAIYDIRQNHTCSCGYLVFEMKSTYGEPNKASPSFSYVKDSVVYMVTDNLEVKPMSTAVITPYIKDFDFEEKQVEVGLHEGLAILKASLETTSVLTTVFLKKI